MIQKKLVHAIYHSQKPCGGRVYQSWPPERRNMVTAKKRELRKECYPDISMDKEYEVTKATMTYLMFKGNPRHYRSTVFHIYINGNLSNSKEAKEYLKSKMINKIIKSFNEKNR